MSHYIRLLANWIHSVDDWQGLHSSTDTPMLMHDISEAVHSPVPADLHSAGVFASADLREAWGEPVSTTGNLAELFNPGEWLYPAPWKLAEIEQLQPEGRKWNDLPDVIVAGVRAGFVFTLCADNRTDAPAEKWGVLAELHGYPLICTLAQAKELLGEPQKAREVEGRSIYDWMHIYDAGEWAYFVNITQIYTPASEWVRWHGVYTYRRLVGSGKV
jgi:hypothetical protein